jgi:plasmid maintenance system antidote protein VapI
LLFELTGKFFFATVAGMNKAETAQLLGITRQHLDFVLSGKRNFSFHAAQRATAVIGGTLSLWLDRDKAADRVKAWERFQKNTRRRVEK